MPRAQVMQATAILGSLLRASMIRARAGPRKATVCKVLRTLVTLHPCLISLSASSPTGQPGIDVPGGGGDVTLDQTWDSLGYQRVRKVRFTRLSSEDHFLTMFTVCKEPLDVFAGPVHAQATRYCASDWAASVYMQDTKAHAKKP